MIVSDRVPFVSDCSLRRIITCGGKVRVSELLHYSSYCRSLHLPRCVKRYHYENFSSIEDQYFYIRQDSINCEETGGNS
jgi:hypothetical protein